MNSWKKIFTLSLVAFQMSTFAISNTAHAADDVITLADLHNSKYNLNSNTKLSFGKLYSAPSDTISKKYSLMTDDNSGHWADVADGHERTPDIPTSITNSTDMYFNPDTSPWQDNAVYVDFQLTGDDTTIIEKSAKRCYDTKAVGGNSNIEYTDFCEDEKTLPDYKYHIMQDIIVDPDEDRANGISNSNNSWAYYQHGDGWGFGDQREKPDGKYGSEDEYEEYKDDLDEDEDRMSRSEYYDEYYPDDDNPHLYILCRSSGTKWTRIHQLYAVSKMQFTVVHAEDVNGCDVKGNVSIDTSDIQYDTSPLTPEEILSQYASESPQTFNMNRVKGTLKIDGANGNKNVATNIVINAKVVEWKLVGWGFLEPEDEGPVGTNAENDWPQFSRIYPEWDIDDHWWNNQGGYWNGTDWHDGYWNDERTLDKAITAANGYAPATINLSYNRNSYSSYDDGYNIDETDPYDLISKSWYGYNTSQQYTRGAFGVIGNWVNQDITTQIYAKDNLSGIDTDKSYVYIDDKSWYGRDDNTRHCFDFGSEQIKTGFKQYANEDELTFTQDGIYYVQGKLWDVADNYHSDSHGAYKLDKTKPDIPLYSDDTRAYIDDPYAVTVTLGDNLSGVDHAVWAISRNSSTYNGEAQHLVNVTTPENSPNAATSFNVPIDSNGTWYIHTWVTDRAGNTTYKVSNGYKFFKITPGDVTVNPTTNGSNILRGTRFDVVTTIPYFTQEDENNSTLHYIMPNWVDDDVDQKVNGQYAITPGTGTDTHCAQYGPSDQAILWKAYVVPYGVPLTKNRDGDVVGPYQTVIIRLQYTNYIYGEKITHDLPIDYSIIPEVIVKTEIINNPL